MAREKGTPKKKKSTSKRSVNMFVGQKKYKIGRRVWNMIKVLQTTTNNCIPRAPFYTLIREILQERSVLYPQMRVQRRALEALQEAAELYIVGIFEDSNLLAAHAKRITVRAVDIQLTLTLRENNELSR